MARRMAFARWALTQAQFVNVAWSLVNLMPVLPWDGGLILDAAVELIAKRPRPKIAAVSSVVVGAAVVLWALSSGSFIMLIYFGGVGIWQGYQRLAPKKPEDETIKQVWELMQAQKFVEAERLAIDQTVRTADPEDRAKLFEAIAWSRVLRDDWRGAELAVEKMAPVRPQAQLAATLLAHEGRHGEVVAMLSPLPSERALIVLRTEALVALRQYESVVSDAIDLLAKSDPALQRIAHTLAQELFHAGAWEPSLQVSLAAFDRLGNPVHLQNAACALTKLGKLDEALAALGRALEAGYKDRAAVLDDPDLAPLRSLPGWTAVVARIDPAA